MQNSVGGNHSFENLHTQAILLDLTAHLGFLNCTFSSGSSNQSLNTSFASHSDGTPNFQTQVYKLVYN